MPTPDSNPFAWRPPELGGPQKTALLVDDEQATLHFYRTGLKGLQGWQLLTADNGMRALDVIRKRTVDVLVTDLNMPVMDGYHLIAAVYERYPSIPIIVLTSLPEGSLQERARELGAMRVLTKPVRLSQLMEEIKLLGNREAQGLVKGIGIASILQLMAWEGRTCTLTVQGPDQLGQIYVDQGRVIHAISHDGEGLFAAYQILSWERPKVEFVDTCRVNPTIDMPFEEILMNLALIVDERAKQPKRPDPWAQGGRT